MLNKLKLTLAALLTLSLFGCVQPDDTSVTSGVSQVQSLAVKYCSFLPTAQTVLAIVSAFDPNTAVPAQAASQMAKAICDTVTAKATTLKAKPGPWKVKVNGKVVTIDGKFVNK